MDCHIITSTEYHCQVNLLEIRQRHLISAQKGGRNENYSKPRRREVLLMTRTRSDVGSTQSDFLNSHAMLSGSGYQQARQGPDVHV